MQMTDKIVDMGLDKLGYKYVNLDDCWQQVNRTEDGHVQPDEKFGNGMAHLAEFIHGRGLLFGLYSSAGTGTCENRTGGLGHEKIDA